VKLLLRVACIDFSSHREGAPGLCQCTFNARPTNPPVGTWSSRLSGSLDGAVWGSGFIHNACAPGTHVVSPSLVHLLWTPHTTLPPQVPLEPRYPQSRSTRRFAQSFFVREHAAFGPVAPSNTRLLTYRGYSLIRKRPFPRTHHRALGIVLL